MQVGQRPWRRAAALIAVALVAACGGSDGDGTPLGETETVQGRVIGGRMADALVCLDLDRNGRCNGRDPQTRTDDGGTYTLAIPKGARAPLLADLEAGRTRDADRPGTTLDASYRMASPSPQYSLHITPLTTVVQLVARRDGLDDLALAEDIVRAELGLPPRLDLQLAAPPASGGLMHTVANAVVSALKTRGVAADPASSGEMARLVAAFPRTLTELPTLRIDTRNAAPIVSREVYVDAVFTLTRPAEPDAVAVINGRIRGRGHSTWGNPKNPYKVQFSNDASFAAIGDVLGMKKNRNWALLADYFDRSLLRNQLALSLGSSSAMRDGLKWTPSGQHLEVWLNGDYVGVYLLTEDIRIDPARLDIRKMSSKPAAGEVDGGYIAEVDARLDCYRGDDVDLQLMTPQGVPICIDTPDEEAITPAQQAYVKDLLLQVEADLYGINRRDRINPASFADWYLVQELFRNNDAAFFSSVFLWKDTAGAASAADRLLNLGPLWDFDLSAGNINYWQNWEIEGCWVAKDFEPNWLARMMHDPVFVNYTIERWQRKRDAVRSYLNAALAAYNRRLQAAQQRNFARWPIFGVQLSNYYMFRNHAEEVAFLSTFLHSRMDWLDRAFASADAFQAMCK